MQCSAIYHHGSNISPGSALPPPQQECFPFLEGNVKYKFEGTCINAGNCSFSRRKLVLLGRIGSFQLRNWFHGNDSYSRRNERCIPLLEGTDSMKFFAVYGTFVILEVILNNYLYI